MKHRSVYHVRYRMYQTAEEKGIDVIASNKVEAYDTATFDKIPELEGESPYSSWVSSVTYNNGRYHKFNTCEGIPY